jgi:hypothetical protein
VELSNQFSAATVNYLVAISSPSYPTADSRESKVKVTLRLTVSQSVSLGVDPGVDPDIYYYLTVTVLFL